MKEEKELTILIKDIFHQSRRAYGSRKIKVVLRQHKASKYPDAALHVICRENGLVSKYNAKRAYKPSLKQMCFALNKGFKGFKACFFVDYYGSFIKSSDRKRYFGVIF
ncbi:IS3 family transposase [Virgibacillus dokdonensis]|uniref:IS3 family transposase n=1 Tax=Virgibacillus dokdonensis TaxID=302167 RepID=UPI0013DD2FC5|nr:IS3 family transposase [Virgibacillus dokdonensis]